MLRVLALLTAILSIVVPGIAVGIWSGRWSESHQLKQAVVRLGRVPRDIGEWTGRDVELDRREVEGAGLAGYLSRRYENHRDGRVIDVVLMCGLPGPVSVHTPDVCYRGAGYKLTAPPSRWSPPEEADGRSAVFWTARFALDDGVTQGVRRILWTWHAGPGWDAPDNPRLTFARFPALYKLYVIQEMGQPDDQAVDGPYDDFIRALLPELEKALAGDD